MRTILLLAVAISLTQAADDGRVPGGPGHGGPGGHEHIFARIDTDGDGSISKAEWDAARERLQAMRQNRQGPGQGPGHGQGARQGLSPEMMQQILARFDTDGDGVLSESERAAAKAAREAKQGQGAGAGRGGRAGARPGFRQPQAPADVTP